jgi:photosystem II stability/assembly factor-like uncharacterized protein
MIHRHLTFRLAATTATLLMLLRFGTLDAQPHWTSAPGADGGIVYRMARDSSGRLLAETRHTLFASSDNGAHWSPLLRSTPDSDFSVGNAYQTLAVTKRGTIVTMASNQLTRIDTSGAIERIDLFGLHGQTTSQVTSLLPTQDGTIYATFWPDDPSQVGLYRSTDDGRSWQNISPGSSGFTEFPNTVVAGGPNVIIAGSANGLYRTTDGGAHWSRNTDIPGIILTYRTGPGTILAMTGRIIYRSIDDGMSWDSLNIAPKGVIPMSITTDPGGRLILATQSGPFVSTDDGISWYKLSSHLMTGGVVVGANGSIFAASKDGVRDMGADGSGWAFAGTGLSAVEITNFYSAPDGRAYACTDASGLLASSDGGRTWRRTSITDRRVMSVIETRKGTILVQVADSVSNKSTIHRSTDGGATWDTIRGTPLYYSTYTTLNEPTPGNIYLGTSYGLYLSTDDGLTWHNINVIPKTVVSTIADSTGFMMAAAGDLYRSTDGGATWDTLPQKVPIVGIARDPRGVIYAARDTGAPMRSIDNGTTWTVLTSAGLPPHITSLIVQPIVVTRQGYLFAATQPRGLMRYVNDTVGWEPAQSGIADKQITRLAETREGVLLAGTSDEGIFRSELPLVGVPMFIPPRSRATVQLLPNPASTQVVMLLPDDLEGHVRIDLFTPEGALVSRLADFESGPDRHMLTAELDGIPSGTYFCRVSDAAGVAVTPLVIVR